MNESEHQTGPRIGMIMPALNEEQALPSVLDEIPRELLDVLVVVDNGSTDETASIARARGATVISEPRRGYGQACLAGLAYLFRLENSERNGEWVPFSGDDIVVFLDADHSDFPEELPDVIAPIASGHADLVIGSRVLGGAGMDALLPQAWFGNRLACILMRLLFGARYSDLGPFRAIRASALRELEMGDTDFGWTIEMQLKASCQGLRITEVPVRYRKRIGKSKITGTVMGTLRAAWKILGWIAVWRVRMWFR